MSSQPHNMHVQCSVRVLSMILCYRYRRLLRSPFESKTNVDGSGARSREDRLPASPFDDRTSYVPFPATSGGGCAAATEEWRGAGCKSSA